MLWNIKAWIVDRDEFIKDANETVRKVNIISIPNAEATIRDETKDFFICLVIETQVYHPSDVGPGK